MNKEKSIYKLPDEWIWTTIGEIGIVQSGGTPSTRNKEFWGDEISWVTPADLSGYNGKFISKGNRSITKMGLDYSSAKLLPKGTILFSSRAPIGYTVITKNELATNQGFKNLIPTKSLNSEYVYYYFQTLKSKAEAVASGTTFLELSATKFSQLPFPLPPSKEQERIVLKIESLFSELDQAEKGLQKAKQQLEIYRQALLKHVYEGKLTEKWRLENKPEPEDRLLEQIKKEQQNLYEQELDKWKEAAKQWNKDGKKGKKPIKPKELKVFQPLTEIELEELSIFKTDFKWVKIGEIAIVKGGKRLPPKHSFSNIKTDYVYIMAGNLKDGTIKNKLTYIEKETYEALINYKVKSGDVYITIVGANIGESGIIPDSHNLSILTENAAKISTTNSIESKFLSNWLNSSFAQSRIKSKIFSATLGKLGLGRVESIEVPLCSNQEQKEIIKIIESKFSIIDELEQTVEKSLNQSKVLSQSILKNAFEGKLVEHFPTDETSTKLLGRIKEEKEKFLEEQSKIKNIAPKKTKKMEKSLSIEDILKGSDKPMLAKKVWQESKHNEDIAEFYAELKELGDKVVEIKEGLNSLLSLKK